MTAGRRRRCSLALASHNRSFTQHTAQTSINSPVPSTSASLQSPPHTFTTRIHSPFPLSLHPASSSLPHVDVNWSIQGNPAGPTIFVMPSMSHSALVTRPRHLRSSAASAAPAPSPSPAFAALSQPGWWEAVVGWGSEYGIDLNVFQVLSASALGAPFGSSSPLSLRSDSSLPYRASFPLITPLDQANCHQLLLTHLLSQPQLLPPPHRLSLPLFCIVGSSMGGMATLHFAVRFPSAYRRAVVICTTPCTSPSTQALRSVQRDAVRIDPAYLAGDYPASSPPLLGMQLARKMGTICYRSRAEFDARFSSRSSGREGGRFPVEAYLDHVSWGWGGRYDANCYLLLSECMDRMDAGQRLSEDGAESAGVAGWQAAARRVRRDSEWLVLPVTEDALIPAEELDRWAAELGSCGVSVHHERLRSLYGHDAFLKEGHTLNPRLAAFLTDGDDSRGGVESTRKYVNELYGH